FNVHKYIEREVEILKEARHPNVVQFMGSIIHDSKVLLVTEFVSGGNVKDWIQDAERELSERMKISIAIDVARAMAYLHAHNIIHRDLKSENLLVTENKRIKVCDFGFSRPTPKTADELRRLSFCGTDSHMAPEIILGIPFDKRVDVFSFGVVLCELAARACVDDSGGVFSRVIPGFGIDEEEVWRRAEKEGAAQRGVEWIAMALKCCETEPADRPSWKAVLGVLKEEELRVIREEPTHAGVLPREFPLLVH
ncbi:kinase-like domain-containing protein, partial [Zopfochytrium polystomum]